MSETKDIRKQIVFEALSWVGTPYILGGRVKGAGCDCSTFLLEVYLRCGLVEPEDVGVFSHDWWAHAKSEVYLRRVMRNAQQVFEGLAYPSGPGMEAIEPGDIVLTRCAGSPVYNHGAIVIEWPRIAHCVQPAVEIANASTHKLWRLSKFAAFDPLKVARTLKAPAEAPSVR